MYFNLHHDHHQRGREGGEESEGDSHWPISFKYLSAKRAKFISENAYRNDLLFVMNSITSTANKRWTKVESSLLLLFIHLIHRHQLMSDVCTLYSVCVCSLRMLKMCHWLNRINEWQIAIDAPSPIPVSSHESNGDDEHHLKLRIITIVVTARRAKRVRAKQRASERHDEQVYSFWNVVWVLLYWPLKTLRPHSSILKWHLYWTNHHHHRHHEHQNEPIYFLRLRPTFPFFVVVASIHWQWLLSSSTLSS